MAGEALQPLPIILADGEHLPLILGAAAVAVQVHHLLAEEVEDVEEPVVEEVEPVSSVEKRAICPENVLKGAEEAVVAHEPVLNVAKRDICLVSVQRMAAAAEALVPALNAEKKDICLENVLKEAEELASIVAKRAICLANVLNHDQDADVEEVAAETLVIVETPIHVRVNGERVNPRPLP